MSFPKFVKTTSPPAKVANPLKPEVPPKTNFSNFSGFSRGVSTENRNIIDDPVPPADNYTGHGCKYFPKICKDRYQCQGFPCDRERHFSKNHLPHV